MVSNSSSLKLGAEIAVELLDARLRLDRELPLAFLADVEIVVDVVLIADVADDLLEHVFDRDQAGHAAVLIHDDRHVVMADAELLEQHVEALALRNEHGRAQALLDVEVLLAAFGEIAQQVLGEQDADDLVAILADHRKARVTRLDHDRQDFLRRIVAIDDDICERGTMMSRTCSSATRSTPSSISKASASMMPRSRAPAVSISLSPRDRAARR